MYVAHESDYYEDSGDSFQRVTMESITHHEGSQKTIISFYAAKHGEGGGPIWKGTLADLVELVKYAKAPQASQ